jgi:hypothetical protein
MPSQAIRHHIKGQQVSQACSPGWMLSCTWWSSHTCCLPSFSSARSIKSRQVTSPIICTAGSSAAAGTAADSARQHQQEAARNPSAIGQEAPAQQPEQAEASTSSAAAAAPPKAQCVVLVTTDVCLKAAPKELLPLGLPLLVQYDLPASKVSSAIMQAAMSDYGSTSGTCISEALPAYIA